MFDDQGNVVGIVCAMHTRAENANYAVKTSYLEALVRRTLGSTEILPTDNELRSLRLAREGETRERSGVLYRVFYRLLAQPVHVQHHAFTPDHSLASGHAAIRLRLQALPVADHVPTYANRLLSGANAAT